MCVRSVDFNSICDFLLDVATDTTVSQRYKQYSIFVPQRSNIKELFIINYPKKLTLGETNTRSKVNSDVEKLFYKG